MEEFLRSLGWDGVSAIVALVGIPTAVLGPSFMRARREITYSVLEDGPIRGLDWADASDLKMNLGDKVVQVTRIRRVVIELSNSGTVDIEPSSYVRPISFDFGEGARVLAARVVKERPYGIKAGFIENFGGLSRVALKNELLNSKDQLVIEIFLVGTKHTHIQVDGRITGVKQIVPKGTKKQAYLEPPKEQAYVDFHTGTPRSPPEEPSPSSSQRPKTVPSSSPPDLPPSWSESSEEPSEHVQEDMMARTPIGLLIILLLVVTLAVLAVYWLIASGAAIELGRGLFSVIGWLLAAIVSLLRPVLVPLAGVMAGLLLTLVLVLVIRGTRRVRESRLKESIDRRLVEDLRRSNSS